jgi:glycosyltransferase involved in cell wall biosynthesis
MGKNHPENFHTEEITMRILFLCNKSPWPPKEGGPMAMNMFISGLVDIGHHVRVLAVNSFKYRISPEEIPSDYRKNTEIEFISVDLRIKPLQALINLISGESYHVTRFDSPDLKNKIIQILNQEKFDIVQLETVFMCPYISTIRRYSSAKIVLRAHNIEHLIWDRIARETSNPLKKWYISQLALALEKYETRVTALVDGIIPITSTDARYFGSIANGSGISELKSILRNVPPATPVRITEIPFGVDVEKYEHPEIQTEFPSLFSLGSMNWIPNQEGIRWFIDQVWPDLHLQYPELKYYLAGRAMPDWMTALRIPNIIVLGEVEDASRFLAEKSIMIVPLFSGSGIRIKIIEGMAAGKTVISTTLGAEGIDCTHLKNILIADSPCEFFEMISICVNERKTCAKIGNEARQLIQSSYKPSTLIQKLVAFYEQLLS